MRFSRKKLAILSIILTVVYFYLAAIPYIIAIQLYQIGIIDVLSITAGTVVTAGFLVCMYLTIKLLKTKILKETCFFVLFVLSFSLSSYVILKIVLKIDFPPQGLITFSLIVGTPVSSILAGYSQRTFWKRLRKLGLTQGTTLVTLFVLVSIPIIEILPNSVIYSLTVTGTIIRSADIVFESGNDTTKVQGQIAKSIFTAEVPIPSDTVFEAKQAVNITNQFSENLYLKIYLEDLSGNLSKVKQLKIFFTLGNGSEICPFSANNGNVKYEEISLRMKSHATIAMGVSSLVQNVSSTDVTVMSLLMRCNEHNLSMNISIDSV